MQSVILGTAQWGIDYGVTNRVGRLSDDAVLAVVSEADDCGITTLDTAPDYGDAEDRIGRLVGGLDVQTKVVISVANPDLEGSVRASLRRLRRESVSAVLVHDWSTAPPEAQTFAATGLEALREAGVVGAVGVSAYGEDAVATALAAFTHLDVVQVAVSILDQRLVGSPAIAEVRARGGRVQARSVFLQGAALADADHALFGDHPDVARLRALGNPLGLCLAYVRTLDWVDELVIAVTSASELAQIHRELANPILDVAWPGLASTDEWLVDPRQWTRPT